MLLGFGLSAFSQDSTNSFDYNYRKGMEHYNKGVDIVNKDADAHNQNPTDDWVDTLVHFKARDEFRQSLPFLLKAYSLNPKNEKLLTALQGVYFSMYDFKESDRYKNELELLKKKK